MRRRQSLRPEASTVRIRIMVRWRLLVEIFYVNNGLAGAQQDTPPGFRIQIKPCTPGGEIFLPDGGFRARDDQFPVQEVGGVTGKQVRNLAVFPIQVNVQRFPAASWGATTVMLEAVISRERRGPAYSVTLTLSACCPRGGAPAWAFSYPPRPAEFPPAGQRSAEAVMQNMKDASAHVDNGFSMTGLPDEWPGGVSARLQAGGGGSGWDRRKAPWTDPCALP